MIVFVVIFPPFLYFSLIFLISFLLLDVILIQTLLIKHHMKLSESPMNYSPLIFMFAPPPYW